MAALLAVVLVLALVQRQRPAVEPDPVTAGDEVPAEPSVHLTLEPQISGPFLLVQGRTDLPTGALLSFEVHHVEDARMRWHQEGHVLVEGGFYEEVVDLSGWEAGDLEVYVSFPSALGSVRQPEEVERRYGPSGERLTGRNVVVYEDERRVEETAVLPYRGPEGR